MTETVFPYPSRMEQKSKKKQTIIIGLVVLVVVIIGIFLLTRKSEKTEENKDSISPTQEATPTEKPKVEKSAVKIQVLNGTGTPGQAGLVVKALEDAGYSADNIKSSNAEKYDNTTTTVTAKSGFEDTASDIKSELQPTFDEVTVESTNLASDSEFDIVVVTGGKIFEESSSSSSSSSSSTSSSSSSSSSTSSVVPSSTSIPTQSPSPTLTT